MSKWTQWHMQVIMKIKRIHECEKALADLKGEIIGRNNVKHSNHA